MMRLSVTFIIISLALSLTAQVAITIPAEYEQNNKLVLTWSYISGIDSVICEITGIAQQSVDVSIIYNPDSTNYDTTQIRNFLNSMNVSDENVNFISIITNTCWLRQYAPVIGYGVFVDDLVQYLGNPLFSNYNQPYNDSVSNALSNYWDMELVNYNLEFENTNIQYDGVQNLFVGEKIFEQNIPMDENEIQNALYSYFNCDNVVFTPYLTQSGGGEIAGNSQYMKVLDYETILVSSIPDTLPDFAAIEDFVANLSSLQNNFGGNYNIIRVPSAPNSNGKFATQLDDEVRSYTNSLILNNIIILPAYGAPEYDSAAFRIYKKYMSGYEIYMVDARVLSQNMGGVNTMSREVPQPEYLRILHQKNIGPHAFLSDYEILCLAASGNEVEEMWLYYKLNDDVEYTRTEIHLVCPQHVGVIPGLLPTDTVHYYIEAVSSTTTTTYPLSAPSGNFTFWFDIVDVEQNKMLGSDFSIAPMPSSGLFKIISDNYYSEIEVEIYNMQGKLVMSTITFPGEIINTGGKLNVGYYNVIIKQNGMLAKLKLAIVN